jgi:quinolinate synthase
MKGKSGIDYRDSILELKKIRNAVILAHYYQEPAIQDIADCIGDSLALAKQAAATQADTIVFAGVHFMAETAKILNPERKVLLPDTSAGCSLADSCQPEAFAAFRKLHPNHVAVTYINCSAEIKALSDIICTSSNAESIINSIPAGQEILFAPDRNLGHYLAKKTGRDLLLWDGACIVHDTFSQQKLETLKLQFPKARIVAHPESVSSILDQADFIGSTSAMLEFVKADHASAYLIATEAGIIHQMRKEAPKKILIPVPAIENNACACSECPYMKLNTVEKLYQCLLLGYPEIHLTDELIKAARKPLNRMFQLS